MRKASCEKVRLILPTPKDNNLAVEVEARRGVRSTSREKSLRRDGG